MKIYTSGNLINGEKAVYINFEREKGDFLLATPSQKGTFISLQGDDDVYITNDGLIEFEKEQATRNYVYGFLPMDTNEIIINGASYFIDDYDKGKFLAQTRENVLFAKVYTLLSLIDEVSEEERQKRLREVAALNRDLIRDKYLSSVLMRNIPTAKINAISDLCEYAYQAMHTKKNRYISGIIIPTVNAPTNKPKYPITEVLSMIAAEEHTVIMPVNSLYKGINASDLNNVPLFVASEKSVNVKLSSLVTGDSSANLALRYFVDGVVPMNTVAAAMNDLPVLVDCDTVVTESIIRNGKYSQDLNTLLVTISNNLYNQLNQNNPEGIVEITTHGRNETICELHLKNIPLYDDKMADKDFLLEFMIAKRCNEIRLNILKKHIDASAKYEYRKKVRDDNKTPKKKYTEYVQRKVLTNHSINPEFMTYMGIEKLGVNRFNIDRIQLRGEKMRLPNMEELRSGKFKKGVCPPLREAGLTYYKLYEKKVAELGKNTTEVSEFLYKEYTTASSIALENDLKLLALKLTLLNDPNSKLWELFNEDSERYVCEHDGYTLSLKMPHQLVNVK